MSKTEDLKKEILNSHTQFKAVIDAGHVKSIKGWVFDPSGKYLLINKHGSWYIYLPNGQQYGNSVKELAEAQRIAKNMSATDKVSKAEERQLQKAEEIYEKKAEANKNIQDLTEEEIKSRDKELSDLSRIIVEAKKNGINPTDLLDDMHDKGEISNQEYLKLSSILNQKDRFSQEAEIIEGHEKNRRSIIDALKESQSDKQEKANVELELLSNEAAGSPDLAQKMQLIKENFPEMADSVSLPMLQRMLLDGVFDEVISGSRSMADAIKSESEKLLPSRPTWDQSKEIFQSEYKPNMAYPQLAPYRNEVSDVAASGQAAGSTGFENARNAEQKAITREDFDFNRDLYRIMQEDWENQSKGIDMLGKHAKSYQDTIMNPSTARQEAWNEGTDKEQNNQFRQDQVDVSIAEGDLKNEIMDMQNSMTLNDRLNAEDDKTRQWATNISNEIYQLGLYKQNIEKLNQEEREQILLLENQLWGQRLSIENHLRAMNNQEAALQALQNASSKKDWITKAMEYLPGILTVAGGVAGGVMGGPAGALQGAAMGSNIGNAVTGQPHDYSKVPQGGIFGSTTWGKGE